MNDDRKNSEGYSDPTPYRAIKNIENEQRRDSKQRLARKTILTVYNVAHLAGFDIVGDITLKDHITGKIYK